MASASWRPRPEAAEGVAHVQPLHLGGVRVVGRVQRAQRAAARQSAPSTVGQQQGAASAARSRPAGRRAPRRSSGSTGRCPARPRSRGRSRASPRFRARSSGVISTMFGVSVSKRQGARRPRSSCALSGTRVADAARQAAQAANTTKASSREAASSRLGAALPSATSLSPEIIGRTRLLALAARRNRAPPARAGTTSAITIHLPTRGVPARRQAHRRAGDEACRAAPETAISSSATRPVATCSARISEQREHRERAQRVVADQVVRMRAPAQVGHHRAGRIDEGRRSATSARR